MPPLVPRKRLRATPPPASAKEPKKSSNDTLDSSLRKRKPTLYDDLDATSTPQSSKQSMTIVDISDDDDDGSSLTSLSSEDFEDVLPAPKKRKTSDSQGDDDDEDDDEDMEFEDVAAPPQQMAAAPAPSGDLELTLNQDFRISLTNPFGEKKGPTKRERKVRNATHCVHVMSLLWHNALRNSWLCDTEVQAVMLSHLPSKIWDEVERWRKNSGLAHDTTKKSGTRSKDSKGGRKKAQGKESRDWGSAADKLEEGGVDMSHGDPLFRLMEFLIYWWKKRFRVTKPGLRKWGYMSLERLDRLSKAYLEDGSNPNIFGERLDGRDSFRQCAKECQGSRDVGAQLFTALLRGLGLEARMVANLQSLGFGWNKLEDAEPEKKTQDFGRARDPEDSPAQDSKGKKQGLTGRKSAKKCSTPISLHDSDELELEHEVTDDESVIELAVVSKRPPEPRKFDQDLEYPLYWTEVLSPVTKKYLPVDPLVKGVVGTNRELIESLEPRGIKADRSRLIMAYIVGYCQDGTAKDVTVRYLKRQMLPGRTKGARMPIEKVPVYNRHGKVKRYEQFDWFKTAMSGYRRGTKDCPLTEVDDLEESTDLKPVQPEKKEVKEGEETLQYYKQSKEFVLERHLKREEALQPGAKAVKVFKNKAKGGKTEEEEVFLRSDVLNVKSAETWHKQGRAPLAGEQPLKRVPYRAATLNRRREILEAEAATGEKVQQGLFSYAQTDWIIPPPIENGIIPKNTYGNIDLFAEHMCPKGAVHIPFRGAVKVCKRLGVDYAEAVVDFEFGHRMAVPVIRGVVIPEEHHDQVIEELQKDEAERERKEDEKRRKACLGRWRKFLMGLRIVERIRQDYGEIGDNVAVFGPHRGVLTTKDAQPKELEKDIGGGFLPAGFEEEHEEEEQDTRTHLTSSFFPAINEDEDEDDDAGDEALVMEFHSETGNDLPPEAPGVEQPSVSQGAGQAQKAPPEVRGRNKAQKPKEKATPRRSARHTRRTRRRRLESDDSKVEAEEWAASDESIR